MCLYTCQSPAYLSELVTIIPHSNFAIISIVFACHNSTTRTSSIVYSQRSFSYADPFLWNNLSVHFPQAFSLHCFKSLLKTHLLEAACLLSASCIVSFTRCKFDCSLYALRSFCIRCFTNVIYYYL